MSVPSVEVGEELLRWGRSSVGRRGRRGRMELTFVKGGMTHPGDTFKGFAAFFAEGDLSIPTVEVGEELLRWGRSSVGRRGRGGGEGRRRWLVFVQGGKTNAGGAFKGFAAFFAE